MLKIKSTFGFLIFAMIIGAGICLIPQNVNAQTDRQNKEQIREQEKDDNDADEKISRKDSKKVKISMKQAREIALQAVEGKIIDEELEKERGRLQYAFDIRDKNGKIFDVEIDAITGKVLQAVEDTEDEKDDDN